MTTKTIINWAGMLFCIEVSDGTKSSEGVRVFQCDETGEKLPDNDREVWIDPHAMIYSEAEYLQVHAYTNVLEGSKNEHDGVPTTLNIHPNKVVLANDGNGTLKRTSDIEEQDVDGR